MVNITHMLSHVKTFAGGAVARVALALEVIAVLVQSRPGGLCLSRPWQGTGEAETSRPLQGTRGAETSSPWPGPWRGRDLQALTSRLWPGPWRGRDLQAMTRDLERQRGGGGGSCLFFYLKLLHHLLYFSFSFSKILKWWIPLQHWWWQAGID